jgi:hypothetical protein
MRLGGRPTRSRSATRRWQPGSQPLELLVSPNGGSQDSGGHSSGFSFHANSELSTAPNPSQQASPCSQIQARVLHLLGGEHLPRRRQSPAQRGKGVSAVVRRVPAGIGTLTVSRSALSGSRRRGERRPALEICGTPDGSRGNGLRGPAFANSRTPGSLAGATVQRTALRVSLLATSRTAPVGPAASCFRDCAGTLPGGWRASPDDRLPGEASARR